MVKERVEAIIEQCKIKGISTFKKGPINDSDQMRAAYELQYEDPCYHINVNSNGRSNLVGTRVG